MQDQKRRGNNKRRNNKGSSQPSMQWRIRPQQMGGKPLLYEKKYYTYGQVVPKLPNSLFSKLRDDNIIEPNDQLSQ